MRIRLLKKDRKKCFIESRETYGVNKTSKKKLFPEERRGENKETREFVRRRKKKGFPIR